TLAVMTRATLGHTGRARTADGATLGVYLAINAAAALRVAAALAPAAQASLLTAAALCWTAAFLGFAAAYGPMLWRRRRAAA
ncbi:MAG: NnrS family protein, partial [Caulobacterales bacterium]